MSLVGAECEKMLSPSRRSEAGPRERQIDMKKSPSALSFGGALVIAFVAACLVVSAAVAQSKADKKDKAADNPKDAVTALQVMVIGGPKDKPVDNASVYLHWEEPRFLRHDRQEGRGFREGCAAKKDFDSSGEGRLETLRQVLRPERGGAEDHDKARAA